MSSLLLLVAPGRIYQQSFRHAAVWLTSVQLFVGPARLDLATVTDDELWTATFVTFTFDSQKNSSHGEVIGQARSGDPNLCTGKSAIRWILCLRANQAAPNTPLATCYYANVINKTVTPKLITEILQAAVKFLTPASLGFLASPPAASMPPVPTPYLMPTSTQSDRTLERRCYASLPHPPITHLHERLLQKDDCFSFTYLHKNLVPSF